MAAERARRDTVARADGEKEAVVLEADGRQEAFKRDAEAKVVPAEASQLAIQKEAEAIRDNDLPVMYLLGDNYAGVSYHLPAGQAGFDPECPTRLNFSQVFSQNGDDTPVNNTNGS